MLCYNISKHTVTAWHNTFAILSFEGLDGGNGDPHIGVVNRLENRQMQIKVLVTADAIRHLFTSAIESGYPVTTASRGGWCAGFYWKSRRHTPPAGNWYYDKPEWYVSRSFRMQIDEVHDERSGKIRSHLVGPKELRHGLEVLAVECPDVFANVVKGDTDASDADCFVQCVVFGKLVYG